MRIPENIFMWYKNSLILTLITVVLTLLVCYFIAYGLTMYKFKLQGFLFFLVIATMCVPFEILMLPLYNEVTSLGIINTRAGVILPGLCGASTIFFFKQYMQSLPKELLDAGRIDGCTEYGISVKIMMPITKPAFASMAILCAMGSWNNMLWPMLVFRDTSKFTLQIGLNTLLTPYGNNYNLLIAGSTGSGKSVCINTLIISILYKAKPDEVKLIMIDPKVVELSVYNGIPHLFIPVVTDPKKASGALHWAVSEMTDRYQKFAEYGVRDLKGYNKKVEGIKDIEDENKPKKMPQIVIIVDELADLMMVAPGEVEDAICRLAQLARAAGIHLIIATQRPSVNVITGLIKANMPSRVAFAVTSGVDSRTILDMNGAEKLLGKGDMLFYPQGYSKPLRVQGAFVSDKEVQSVVDFLTEKMEMHRMIRELKIRSTRQPLRREQLRECQMQMRKMPILPMRQDC